MIAKRASKKIYAFAGTIRLIKQRWTTICRVLIPLIICYILALITTFRIKLSDRAAPREADVAVLAAATAAPSAAFI